MKGSKVEIVEGYPQLVWHNSSSNSNKDSTNSSADLTSKDVEAKAEDQVMHYIVKVDR